MDNLIVRLEINYSEKLVLCSSDTAATCKLSDISVITSGNLTNVMQQ